MNKSVGFAMVEKGNAAKIYVDMKGKDYDGLSLVAASFADDIETVTGIRPEVTANAGSLSGTAVIAGSVGNNSLIDAMITEGRIDISDIKNKRETYRMQVVLNPFKGLDKALVVVGSDKRGTIYGLYHISELIGVSPWVYWGDVKPEKRAELVLPEDRLNFTSKEPSVKYRGIFLNDEWPSLGSWVMNTFGDFNEEFYDKVFQLVLRLKGNFMWPAMWDSIFSENGKSSNNANLKLANAYGIVMGTSHHEPMFRAGEEWQKFYRKYGTSNEWNFRNNGEAITLFWEDGVIRNKGYESLITLGMRGERDSTLGGDIQENIELLKSIITTQKEILKKHGLADAPQVLTLYKEVEQFWYGTKTVPGLKDWDVLSDVTIMLAEDNFGNTRTLPTPLERDRKAGWGMYYHVDYHGGPVSYEWVNTTPIEKIWEQMSMVYDYGVRDIWIINVGDLKPMELPMSYFLNLAYDFDTWGTEGINRTREYVKQWTGQQFGNASDKDTLEGIAEVLSGYTRLSGICKPEVLTSTTYSNINYNEAQRMLDKAIDIENAARKYYRLMPEEYRDSYYQLVYYPAVATANINKMQIYAGLNQRYHNLGSVLANKFATYVEEAIEADEEMQRYYNETMSGGKWRGIMSSVHIGYVSWNADGWRYPQVCYVTPHKGASMIVDVEGTEEGYSSGTADLPLFTNLLKERYSITISNGGDTAFDYTAETSADWIKIDHYKGSIRTGKKISVSVDWQKLLKSSMGDITIKGAGQTVKVRVTAEVTDTESFPHMTFVGKNNVISIEAEHTFNSVAKSGVRWKVIENYGRTLSALKMYPTTAFFEKAEAAPYLEYMVYLAKSGEYTLTVYTAPSNNLFNDGRLRYGVSFDAMPPVIADSLPPDYISGDCNNEPWCTGVLNNIHISTTKHILKKGLHILRFHGVDAGLVLQKLVLSAEPLPASYLGPEESYFKRSRHKKLSPVSCWK
jgi:hypothetical protein